MFFLERRYSEGEYYRNTRYNGKGVSSYAGKSVSTIFIGMQRELCLKKLGISPKLIREISFLRNLLAQFQREETQLFVLRVMVGLVILYDHVHPQGAFVKGSNVDVSIRKHSETFHEINFTAESTNIFNVRRVFNYFKHYNNLSSSVCDNVI